MYSQERMKLLVERMAGVYSSSFHDGVTHLVTVKVCIVQVALLWSSRCFMFQALSQKYNVAVRKEDPVMLPAWVEDVWAVSSSEMVTAGDPRFAHHNCRAMQGASSTGTTRTCSASPWRLTAGPTAASSTLRKPPSW